MAAKIVDKDLKRREIAKAAIGVFSERGFESTSMSLVADAAGVGKGTIYEYFGSKDEMIASAILLWIQDLIEGARSLSQNINDPELRLKTFVKETMKEFVTDRKTIQTAISVFNIVLLNIDNIQWADPIQTSFKEIWGIIVEIITDGSEKGVFEIKDRKEAEMIAINLLAFLDGICLHYYVSGGRFNMMAQVDHYMKYLLEETLK